MTYENFLSRFFSTPDGRTLRKALITAPYTRGLPRAEHFELLNALTSPTSMSVLKLLRKVVILEGSISKNHEMVIDNAAAIRYVYEKGWLHRTIDDHYMVASPLHFW